MPKDPPPSPPFESKNPINIGNAIILVEFAAVAGIADAVPVVVDDTGVFEEEAEGVDLSHPKKKLNYEI